MVLLVLNSLSNGGQDSVRGKFEVQTKIISERRHGPDRLQVMTRGHRTVRGYVEEAYMILLTSTPTSNICDIRRKTADRVKTLANEATYTASL